MMATDPAAGRFGADLGDRQGGRGDLKEEDTKKKQLLAVKGTSSRNSSSTR
jgi:hypothetical protein